jgi:LPXTG-motif cell wall-anchored protein
MIKTFLYAAVVFLAAAPTALGGSSQAGYAGSAGNVQGSVQKSGSLPFTGLSLTAFAIVGLLLIVTGVYLFRRGNRSVA